jgi:hypothetical protein
MTDDEDERRAVDALRQAKDNLRKSRRENRDKRREELERQPAAELVKTLLPMAAN